jgi:mycothiol S-conjugate amidase
MSAAEPLCILTVHAHPDDEASKGAPTLARYAHEGVKTVLVCCTGGEEGGIHNPALLGEHGPFHGLEGEEYARKLHTTRMAELARSAAVIGFRETVFLGYRDSGMKDEPSNEHPECFHQADLDEAIGRLVTVIRRTKPHVLITYNDDQSGYPHPDHVKVHDISVPAFQRAGDPMWYPWAGPAWQPLKLYYTVWSRARMLAVHQAMVALHGSSPFDEKWFERPSQDHRITTKVDVHDFLWARTEALLAHETQIDPGEPFWFGLSDDELAKAYPWEDWVLAASAVGGPAEGELEDDLFAGVREAVLQ